jgi:hypothetical protein
MLHSETLSQRNIHTYIQKILFTCVCISEYTHNTCMLVASEARKGYWSPGAAVTGICELPDGGAENPTPLQERQCS